MSEIRFKEKDFMDKLDWEWEEFSCNVTSLSRENIFSMAEMVAERHHTGRKQSRGRGIF